MITVISAGLDPDNDEARRWLEDELRKRAYSSEKNWWQRFSDAVGDWFGSAVASVFGDHSSVPTTVSIVLVVLLVAAAAFLVSRIRRNRRARPAESDRSVLGRSTLTAAEYRERAAVLLADGDYLRSVVNSMRAIAQEAVERTLLTRAASLTAHEIANRLTMPFPDHARQLRIAADTFDEIAYGDRTATHDDALSMQALDSTLKRTKPRFPDESSGATASLPLIREAAR